MSSSKFLDYEVALLLAKYGKAAVLKALASKLQLTTDQLDTLLQTALRDGSTSRTTKKQSPIALVARLAREYPTKEQLLRTLYGRFVNRTFLPEFRDVKRFLEQHDHPLGASKSRADSLPKVLKLLATLDSAELEALCQAQPETAYSSLGVISDEILRRDR